MRTNYPDDPINDRAESVAAIDERMIMDGVVLPPSPSLISPFPGYQKKEIKLKDGTKVLLRPIQPEDELLWLDMFRDFSAQTIRYRFFSAISEPSQDMISRFCHIDNNQETAIVAEIEDRGKKQLLGVFRFIVDPIKTDVAEFAVVVRDRWQKRGLGSAFMDFVFPIARNKGLRRIYGSVLGDNVPMIRFCLAKNFTLIQEEPGEYRIEQEI